jgi:hypothetical protein
MNRTRDLELELRIGGTLRCAYQALEDGPVALHTVTASGLCVEDATRDLTTGANAFVVDRFRRALEDLVFDYDTRTRAVCEQLEGECSGR